jgi:uroporphyrinogen-III synthase
MRILITRPLEDATSMAERLRALGYSPVIVPLLTIHFRDGPEISLDGVQAILATSANGVRAIARRTQRREVPVFAVGPQTAEAAKAHGFSMIHDADGDAEALAAAIPKWTVPDRGILLHAVGAEAPKVLASRLSDAGFDVRRETLYEASAISKLPPALEMHLKNGSLEGAIFMSPRSAQTFASLVARAGLDKSAQTIAAFCISEATENALSPLQFRNTFTAAKPNQSALLSLLSASLPALASAPKPG